MLRVRQTSEQHASGIAADLAARASDLGSLCDVENVASGTEQLEEAWKRDPDAEARPNEKAQFDLIRTDGYICTREKVDGTRETTKLCKPIRRTT